MIKNSPYIENSEIGVQTMSVTYVQNADTNDKPENYQYIKLTAVDVPTSGDYDPDNPPFYINIEILPFDDGAPGHWSIDEPNDLVAIVNDFKERLMHVKKTN